MYWMNTPWSTLLLGALYKLLHTQIQNSAQAFDKVSMCLLKKKPLHQPGTQCCELAQHGQPDSPSSARQGTSVKEAAPAEGIQLTSRPKADILQPSKSRVKHAKHVYMHISHIYIYTPITYIYMYIYIYTHAMQTYCVGFRRLAQNATPSSVQGVLGARTQRDSGMTKPKGGDELLREEFKAFVRHCVRCV